MTSSIQSSSQKSLNLFTQNQRSNDISHFIISKKWQELLNALGQKKTLEEPKALRDDLCCLHLACRFDPPLTSVTALHKTYPESIKSSDYVGRYPLHLAAEWGASPSVIKFLVEKNPSAVGFQDFSGRTPLHYMCQQYAKRCQVRRGGQRISKLMLKIVKVLCRAAPSTVNVEDYQGMNALEYAIEADADIDLVQYLQEHCASEWKMKQKEGMKHASIKDKPAERSEWCKRHATNTILDVSDATNHSLPNRNRRQPFDMQKTCYMKNTIAVE
uniref:Uncharacterized protein n=1 Tax=Helicotheca tamesis TaxID=374047 RepID=A0A7S2MMT4_9STRA